MCDATNTQSSPVMKATPEGIMTKGNLYTHSSKEASMVDMKVLPFPMNTSKEKTADYQGWDSSKARAIFLPNVLVLGQTSSEGSQKFSLFQAMAITTKSNQALPIAISYQTIIPLSSSVLRALNVLAVTAVANYSYNWDEIVKKVQSDEAVKLGEPPPQMG